MKRNPVVLGLLLFSSCLLYSAPRPGVAPLGLDAWSEASVDALSECVVASGGDVEIAALAYSFNPNTPFTNWTRLVVTTLPRMTGRLYLTAYLDDGPNRRRTRGFGPYFRSDLSPAGFWRTLTPSNRAADRAAFRQLLTDWGNNVLAPYEAWVTSIRAWAASQGLENRLVLIVVPVLEDDAGSNLAAYQKLLDVTKQLLSEHPIRYRRNPATEIKTGLRIGDLPLEFHTNRRSVVETGLNARVLRANDVINNDGCFVLYPDESDPGGSDNCPPISIERFRSNQQFFIAHNLSSLLWRFEFNANGVPRKVTRPPDERGVLTPLDDQRAQLRLLRTLKAR